MVKANVRQPDPYGHPDPNAVAELDGVVAQIWWTDQRGTITISFTGPGAGGSVRAMTPRAHFSDRVRRVLPSSRAQGIRVSVVTEVT